MAISGRPLTSFKCLTFDCYGTLVDWEGAIWAGLAPVRDQVSLGHPLRTDRAAWLQAFIDHEGEVQRAQPDTLYSFVLAETYSRVASDMGVETTVEDQKSFGASVGEWSAFPDTVDTLRRLQEHYKLVILSNVDRNSFQATLGKQLPGIKFDAIYTAQDIGSYKSDLCNFRYLLDKCEQDLGVAASEIIHTAQSLRHDHVPAKQVGLASAWIERGAEHKCVMGGTLAEFEDKVAFSWHFRTLGEMADAVEAELKAKQFGQGSL